MIRLLISTLLIMSWFIINFVLLVKYDEIQLVIFLILVAISLNGVVKSIETYID